MKNYNFRYNSNFTLSNQIKSLLSSTSSKGDKTFWSSNHTLEKLMYGFSGKV